jgi:hypothetical protein
MGATKLSYSLKLLPLTFEEKTFIQGCLLGDGTLAQSGKYHRLRIAHKVEHKEYVIWKYNNIKRLCVSQPTLDKVNQSFRFGTVGHPEITTLRNMWYQPLKQIPSSFHLDERTLAIWFMDDGCKTGKTVNFSVHNFAEQSVIMLQQALLRMGIRTNVHSDGKGKRLYVLQTCYPIFKEFVKPHMLTCMAYKLP